MKKSSIAFLILLVMLFTVALQACSEATGDNNSSASAASESSETSLQPEQSEESSSPVDDTPKLELPDDLMFPDEEVTILIRTGDLYQMEFGTEEIDDSALNALLIERTQAVEERLGIKINTIVQQTDAGTYAPNNFNQKVMNAILSGDPGYDLIAFYAYYGVKLGTDQYLYNMWDVPYLNFEKPWWNRDYIEEMTVNNNLYFLVGDACFTSLDFMFTMYFNKDLVARHYPDVNLYDIVDKGDWTMDTYRELIKDTYEERDGDGLKSDGDFFGMYAATAATPLDAMFAAMDCKITEKNSDGIPELIFYNERCINFFDTMYEFLFETPGVQPGHYTGESGALAKEKFEKSESIFCIGTLNYSETLRDANFVYGILPIPKMNKDQEFYHTCCTDGCSILAIPNCIDEERLELIGATMELFAYESYKTVTPNYFTKIVKNGYLDSDDDLRMYDILHDGMTYNFGVSNSCMLNDIQHLVREVLDKRSRDFKSAYDSVAPAAEKALNDLIENYN